MSDREAWGEITPEQLKEGIAEMVKKALEPSASPEVRCPLCGLVCPSTSDLAYHARTHRMFQALTLEVPIRCIIVEGKIKP